MRHKGDTTTAATRAASWRAGRNSCRSWLDSRHSWMNGRRQRRLPSGWRCWRARRWRAGRFRRGQCRIILLQRGSSRHRQRGILILLLCWPHRAGRGAAKAHINAARLHIRARSLCARGRSRGRGARRRAAGKRRQAKARVWRSATARSACCAAARIAQVKAARLRLLWPIRRKAGRQIGRCRAASDASGAQAARCRRSWQHRLLTCRRLCHRRPLWAVSGRRAKGR